MRKWLLLPLLAIIVLAFVVQKLVGGDGGEEEQPTAQRAVATIGSGEDAVAVGADGTLLRQLAPPAEDSLPELPLVDAPEKDRLAGTLLEQVRVLAAAPRALWPYLARSYYGESGVDVELRSGIELGFGSASQAARKWRAAATILADPSVTALDYVDLHAPSHPALGGSGHTLPPLP
jgi:hypothetical protein